MGQQADQIRNGDIPLDEKLAILAVWVEQDKALWDVLTALRGPDFPSEIGDGSGVKNAAAYDQRRKRKYATTEIIRAKSGLHGGAARFHAGDHVTVPPFAKQDHFDRHVVKAAQALGITVKVEGEVEQPSNLFSPVNAFPTWSSVPITSLLTFTESEISDLKKKLKASLEKPADTNGISNVGESSDT
jgi:hypothetical protein